MADSTLVIRIGATSKQFNDELRKIQRQTRDLQNSLMSVAKVSGAAFAGLATVAGGAVFAYAKFDDQLRGVKPY